MTLTDHLPSSLFTDMIAAYLSLPAQLEWEGVRYLEEEIFVV